MLETITVVRVCKVRISPVTYCNEQFGTFREHFILSESLLNVN